MIIAPAGREWHSDPPFRRYWRRLIRTLYKAALERIGFEVDMSELSWHLKCVRCDSQYDGLDLRYRCDCGETLDVVHNLEQWKGRITLDEFDRRRLSRDPLDRSGVWRFRELILPLEPHHVVTKPEGNTNIYRASRLETYTGAHRLWLKHEGENPTASFKDRGMTVGASIARRMGLDRVACASTGNTAASMAAYAAGADMQAYVFIPEGQIAYGKLSQALAYGARTIQIDGDFDQAMQLVQEVCDRSGIYLLNSVNPFRIEGQKAIVFELLQDLGWEIPDWIVLPGGNLGNSSALGKGLHELRELGLISRLPRVAVVQASGANPLYTAFTTSSDLVPVPKATTRATAIKIGNPVSWRKSMRAVRETDGVVTEVTEQEIFDAKAQVDRAGIGAEPASCATVAGVKKLVAEGVIEKDAIVAGVLTGHLLKDPDAVVDYHCSRLSDIDSTQANAPIKTPATLAAVLAAIEG